MQVLLQQLSPLPSPWLLRKPLHSPYQAKLSAYSLSVESSPVLGLYSSSRHLAWEQLEESHRGGNTEHTRAPQLQRQWRPPSITAYHHFDACCRGKCPAQSVHEQTQHQLGKSRSRRRMHRWHRLWRWSIMRLRTTRRLGRDQTTTWNTCPPTVRPIDHFSK